MVECTPTLDSVFGSLSDPIRRDILRRVAGAELSVNDVAKPYPVTLAAVSKHLKVLEKAALIIKTRRGKQQFVRLSPGAFRDADAYLDFYKQFSSDRLDSLEHFLNEENHHDNN